MQSVPLNRQWFNCRPDEFTNKSILIVQRHSCRSHSRRGHSRWSHSRRGYSRRGHSCRGYSRWSHSCRGHSFLFVYLVGQINNQLVLMVHHCLDRISLWLDHLGLLLDHVLQEGNFMLEWANLTDNVAKCLANSHDVLLQFSQLLKGLDSSLGFKFNMSIMKICDLCVQRRYLLSQVNNSQVLAVR